MQLGSGVKRLVRDACVLRGEEMIPEEWHLRREKAER